MGDNIWQNVFQEIFKKNLELMKQEPETAGLNALFDRAGAFEQLTIGEVRLKTGRIEIGDPLCYINTKYSCTLEETVEPGSYPVSLSVIDHPVFGFRFLAAKLDVNGKTPVRYELAMSQGYTIEDKDKPGVFAMFGVDTGLACICDRAVSVVYDDFIKEWRGENPDKNLYDDFFAEAMKAYAEQHPRYQREDGDYMDWCLPGSDENLILFTSGFGDGAYSSYWGIDENGDKACLVIRFIDPEAYDVPMPELPRSKKFFMKAEEIKPLLESGQFGIATDKIMVEGSKVGYMVRNEPQEEHPEDSGWIFYEGSEDREYCEDSGHFGLYDLNTVANYDPDIIPLLDAPAGMAFFRGDDGKFYVDAGANGGN